MKKIIKAFIILAVLVAIVCTSWLFFRSSMSIHPLVRDCYAALVRLDPGSEGYLMKIACFAIDDKDGARLLLICEKPGKGSPQKPEAAEKIEAVFPLTQDPATPQPKAGSNPFENPGLVISSFTVKENDQSKTFTVDPPLRGIPDTYYEGTEPNPEKIIKTHLVSTAFTEALEIVEKQDTLLHRIGYIEKETLYVLGTVSAGTSFFGTFGVVLYTFTPIVQWLGYIFWPFFRIFGFTGEELSVACTGAMISFVEVTVPALLVAAGVWSMRLRFMLAVLPVTSIIFLASFVPCCMGTEVPVKFWHLCVIWLERMILSILITGIFAMILFPASMVI